MSFHDPLRLTAGLAIGRDLSFSNSGQPRDKLPHLQCVRRVCSSARVPMTSRTGVLSRKPSDPRRPLCYRGIAWGATALTLTARRGERSLLRENPETLVCVDVQIGLFHDFVSVYLSTAMSWSYCRFTVAAAGPHVVTWRERHTLRFIGDQCDVLLKILSSSLPWRASKFLGGIEREVGEGAHYSAVGVTFIAETERPSSVKLRSQCICRAGHWYCPCSERCDSHSSTVRPCTVQVTRNHNLKLTRPGCGGTRMGQP